MINSILNKIFASNLCSFMHRHDHGVSSFFFINFLHSRSHDMNNTKEDLALLFTSDYTRKCLFNALSFDVTMIRKYVTGDQRQYLLWIIVKASATVSASSLLTKKWA